MDPEAGGGPFFFFLFGISFYIFFFLFPSFFYFSFSFAFFIFVSWEILRYGIRFSNCLFFFLKKKEKQIVLLFFFRLLEFGITVKDPRVHDGSGVHSKEIVGRLSERRRSLA